MSHEDRLYQELLAEYVRTRRDIRLLTDLAYDEHYEFHLAGPIRFCNHATCRLVGELISA